MKRFWTAAIIAALIAACAGCSNLPAISNAPVPSPISTISTPPATIPSSPSPDTVTPQPWDEGIPSITLGDVQALSTGATLAELGGYLKMTKNEILSILGDTDNTVSNGWAQTFHYENPGINIVCRDTDMENYDKDKNLDTTFIECDADKVMLGGVQKSMDFAQIQEKLGKTGVVKVERVPGICSYELRYIINGVRLKFFSWKIDGSDAFNLNIVKTFDTDDDFIRITPEKIGELFSKSKDKLRQIFGESEELPDRSAVMLSYYQKYGMAFVNQKDGNKKYFDHISLDSRYEINGAREGMNLNQIMGFMGKAEFQNLGGEDPYTYISYRYKTFSIMFLTDLIGSEGEDMVFEIWINRR